MNVEGQPENLYGQTLQRDEGAAGSSAGGSVAAASPMSCEVYIKRISSNQVVWSSLSHTIFACVSSVSIHVSTYVSTSTSCQKLFGFKSRFTPGHYNQDSLDELFFRVSSLVSLLVT